MAAGAAHEMNNPLMVISGRAKLLEQTLSDGKQKDAARKIFENSQRLSDIITELMHFAKPETPQPQIVRVSQLLQTAISQAKQASELADRTVDVRAGDVPDVHVDVRQVSAAIAEILANAAQATAPGTGRIEVSAAFDPYSQRVVLSISDNGCGMDELTLKFAFDPFFSSKKAGRRRGMGLSKALRWAESSGGSIRLESAVDRGTRAFVLLPAADAAASLPDRDGGEDQAITLPVR
jgi:signal transduction histidine kinase